VAISEIDLTTMAQIGAQVTSKDTYATAKLALENADAGYADKDFKVFLQGSYGNDTNIIRESDVDVVIRLDSIFTYDINSLPIEQQNAFKDTHPAATYTHSADGTQSTSLLRVGIQHEQCLGHRLHTGYRKPQGRTFQL
jgi:hypothetical protein